MPRYARARHVPGQMNSLERAYADELTLRQAAGLIREWRFEPLKLRLAPATYYSPDFLVILSDDTVEIHEVKGRWEDDARVKIKVAATLNPWFRFVAVTKRPKRDGGWSVEEIAA